MTIQEINSSDFKELIKKDKVVVKFTAPWCSACRVLSPTYKELSNELTNIKFTELDVDKSPNIAQQYEIRGIPTLILFENGKEIKRLAGVISKEELKRELK